MMKMWDTLKSSPLFLRIRKYKKMDKLKTGLQCKSHKGTKTHYLCNPLFAVA